MLALPLAALLLAAPPVPPAPAGAARPESPLAIAARLAAARLPKARWRLGDARSTDVTLDGQADQVLLGVDQGAFVLAVVEGPVTDRSAVHLLRLRSGPPPAEDAVCGPAAEVQANVERPDARPLGARAGAALIERVDAAAEAGGEGLVLVHAGASGYCRAFHVLYDGAGLAWWRAPPGGP